MLLITHCEFCRDIIIDSLKNRCIFLIHDFFLHLMDFVESTNLHQQSFIGCAYGME